MQEEPFPSRKNSIIYGSTKVVASKVTNDTVANVQPIFLFKPVGMARKEINNAFLRMSSFKLLSAAERLLWLDPESVVGLQRWMAVFVITPSASHLASSAHSRHLKNPPPAF